MTATTAAPAQAIAAAVEAGTASAPGHILDASRLEHEAARARTERLFREHGRMVRGLCCGLLRDRAEAEDAAQQTFLAAHRALLRGGAPREPAAWLAAIARNECLARVRERMREPLPVTELRNAVSTSDPVTLAIARADLRAVWQAVSELSPKQRRAFVLREFGGLSYEELAVALGVSTGAIESLLHRARTRLRSRLETVLASFGVPGWLAFLRDLVPRWLDAGGATKVAAATAATVVAGGTFVGERELIRPHHAVRSASSALLMPRPVERAAATATPVAAAARLDRPRHAGGRRASLRAAPAEDAGERAEIDGSRTDGGGESGRRSGSDGAGPGPGAASPKGDRASGSGERTGGGFPEGSRTGSSGPRSGSGKRGGSGESGSEDAGLGDPSGEGSSGEASRGPEGLASSGSEDSGSGLSGSLDSGSGSSSGSDEAGSGPDGSDSGSSGSGKGSSEPDGSTDD